ncbi:MAG: efflux RND transporter periplasmic adaptor subunit [Opitutales bacterium]|nr:efflux RND transporter periplasmic adaptor subunit [Opitutales bacterium]
MKKPVYYLLIPALLLVGCGKEEVANQTERLVPVSVAETPVLDFSYIERSVGHIYGNVTPQIVAEAEGNTVEVYVEAGDIVTKGQPLLMIDQEPYQLRLDSAKAGLAQAQAMYDYQKVLYDRQTSLKDGNYISSNDLESSEAQLKLLEAQRDSAAASLALAERDMRNTVVKAPFSGTIDSRLVDLGDYVKQGNPVFSLVTAEKLRISLPFPESLARVIQPGQKVTLVSPVDKSQVVNAVLNEVKPAVSGASRSIEAVIYLDNPGSWVPGASVNAEVITQVKSEAVVIDRVALIQRPAGNVVYTLEGDHAKELPVTVGRIDGDKVEILDGLPRGAKVIVEGAYYLSNGAKVKVTK